MEVYLLGDQCRNIERDVMAEHEKHNHRKDYEIMRKFNCSKRKIKEIIDGCNKCKMTDYSKNHRGGHVMVTRVGERVAIDIM